MLRLAVVIRARRKHGQKAWSPNATSSGAAPANGITAQEALQIAYRPMPPAQTVEYEEDFGPNMMIHREFVSKKNRSQMSFDVSALSYSDVELRQGRQQLASVMNRERRGVLVGAGGLEGDRVSFNLDVDDDTREVRSARYLFNESRLQFCDRYQMYFRDRLVHTGGGNGDADGKGEDKDHPLFSLMEACAIIYGCDTAEAQEAYYRRFLQLDLDSLEADEEALRERVASAAEVERELMPALDGSGSTSVVAQRGTAAGASLEETVRAVIEATPLLFEDITGSSTHGRSGGDGGGGENVNTNSASSAANSSPPTPHAAATVGSTLPSELEEYAPLYKAYLAHARGESPVASYDMSTIGSSSAIAERRRWRDVMEKVVREDYHTLTEAELHDASILNNQLHTVKFLDLKIGDTVREIMQLLQRETGDGSSIHRDAPLGASESHPERRT